MQACKVVFHGDPPGYVHVVAAVAASARTIPDTESCPSGLGIGCARALPGRFNTTSKITIIQRTNRCIRIKIPLIKTAQFTREDDQVYNIIADPCYYSHPGGHSMRRIYVALVEHGGSHPHLVHEFVQSIVEGRTPRIDAVIAADWCAAGICAHESAVQDGELVRVPRFDES
jgi:hypothetical protein